MSKLRVLKILLLIAIFCTAFFVTIYAYDTLASRFALNHVEFKQVKYVLAFLTALSVTAATNRVSRQIYFSLRQVLIKLSLADFIIGIISIVIGLILGGLASAPMASLPDPWSWLLSLVVAILTTALVIWAFSLKKQTILDWVNSLHIFQRMQLTDKGLTKSSDQLDSAVSYINPMVIDTSAIIDQRIAEIIKSGFLYGTILLPSFILEELQHVADSSIAEKRQRGRLGLKLLQQIKRSKKIPVVTLEDVYPEIELVDSKLVQLAKDYKAKIITCDYNLNAVAKVRGVSILNVNELAIGLQYRYLPGDIMEVHVQQSGKEDNQGIGHLADGTLVVVQKGKAFIGKDVTVEVQRVLQNAAGRMIFVKAIAGK